MHTVLCRYRLNWARRTSWGWWDNWADTVLQTQDSKFKPWRSEVEHATSLSRMLPTILTLLLSWSQGRSVSSFKSLIESSQQYWSAKSIRCWMRASLPATGTWGAVIIRKPRPSACQRGRQLSRPDERHWANLCQYIACVWCVVVFTIRLIYCNGCCRCWQPCVPCCMSNIWQCRERMIRKSRQIHLSRSCIRCGSLTVDVAVAAATFPCLVP